MVSVSWHLLYFYQIFYSKIGEEQSPEDAEDGPPELLFIHGGHTAKDCINLFVLVYLHVLVFEDLRLLVEPQ